MRKVLITLLISILLCGCTPTLTHGIETLKDWSFQYNDKSDDYSLFFALLDDRDKYVDAEADVDIRIVDDDGNEIFKDTYKLTEEDFGYYGRANEESRYLANVVIDKERIDLGTSNCGTVYFTVHKERNFRFDEVSIRTLYSLPVQEIKISSDLPIEVEVYDYDGSVASVIQIDEISYSTNMIVGTQTEVTVSAIKTSGNNSRVMDIFSYKLYDKDGYVIDSGNVFLTSLKEGDKFRDDSIWIYDLIPGEEYSLQFMEYSR